MGKSVIWKDKWSGQILKFLAASKSGRPLPSLPNLLFSVINFRGHGLGPLPIRIPQRYIHLFFSLSLSLSLHWDYILVVWFSSPQSSSWKVPRSTTSSPKDLTKLAEEVPLFLSFGYLQSFSVGSVQDALFLCRMWYHCPDRHRCVKTSCWDYLWWSWSVLCSCCGSFEIWDLD